MGGEQAAADPEKVRCEMRRNLAMLFFVQVVLLFSIPAFAQSDEARRHFDRGMAAVEMAKAPEDLQIAINEFKQATTLAPDWPDAFFNLGKVQEAAEKFTDAIASLRRYLELAPNAPDAADVKSLINKIDYKAENVMTVPKVMNVLTELPKWRSMPDSGLRNFIRRKGPASIEVPSSILWKAGVSVPDVFYRELTVTGPRLDFHYTTVLLDRKNVANYTVDIDVELQVVSLKMVRVKEVSVWRYWSLGGDPITRINAYELVP